MNGDTWRNLVSEGGSPSGAGSSDAGTMTIDRFVLTARGDRALIDAFGNCERLASAGNRKLTSDAWQAAFASWCNTSRA